MSLHAHFWTTWEFLGRRISVLSGDDREHLLLFQCISVAIQRFNAVFLHDGFPAEDHPDYVSTSNFVVFFLIFSHPRFYEGLKIIIIIIIIIN